MTDPALPISLAELAHQLNQPLGPRRDGLELAVHSAELVKTGVERGLLLDVEAHTAANPIPQRWRVTLPLGPDDPADPLNDLDPQSFVITCRANLEEWWDMKAHEPHIAAWGQTLDVTK